MSGEIERPAPAPDFRVVICRAAEAQDLVNQLGKDYMLHIYQPYVFEGLEKVHMTFVHHRVALMQAGAAAVGRGLR